MSRMRIALLLPLLLVASCATTLVKQDIKRQSDGWTIVFHELDDGPDSFTTRDAYQMSPPSGQRFLWVILSVHNDGAKARAFSFDSCNLPLAGAVSLPVYVGMNFGTSAETTKAPELAAGEEITRKLAFGYPEGQLPDRITCAGNDILLKRQ